MNELLFFITIFINFIGVTLFYKLFKKAGVYTWIGIATIVANIEATKCVDMFGLSLTLGNVVYSTVFLATDILSEMYGGKEARKGVGIGFLAMLVFTLVTQVDILFVPNSQDLVSESMKTIFSFMPRFCIASMVTYAITNTLDTYLYDWIRKLLPADKFLWVRNNAATLISQLVDSFLFTILAFTGIYSFGFMVELSLTTFVMKFIVAILDTPFLYIAKKISIKDEEAIQSLENKKEN